jgi:hypothetical protein
MSEMIKYEQQNVERYQPKDSKDLFSIAQQISKSGLKPASLKTPEDVFIVLMTGVELGLQVMQSLRGIHVINGKPCMSAELLMGVCQNDSRCEYMHLVESTNTIATYITRRRNSPEPVTMSYTISDAKTAGLSGGNWAKHPAAMLRARASSAICRAVYSDIVMGLYTEDEVQHFEPAKKSGNVSSLNDKFQPVVKNSFTSETVKDSLTVEVSIAPQTFDHLPEWKAAAREVVALVEACNGESKHASLYMKHEVLSRGLSDAKQLSVDDVNECIEKLGALSDEADEDGLSDRMAFLLGLK